jgi:hypothetical protein
MAHVLVFGYVSKQNLGYWSYNCPVQIHVKTLRSGKVIILRSPSTFVVIGNYLRKTTRQLATVESRWHLTILEKCFSTKLPRIRQKSMGWRGLRNEPHGKASIIFLRTVIPYSLVSRSGDFPLPPHPPELTAPEIFFPLVIPHLPRNWRTA